MKAPVEDILKIQASSLTPDKDMVLSSSIPIWEKIERLKSDEQKHLLQWQLQARESILSFADMRAGDHLVRKDSFMKGLIPYEHHFLCIGFDDEDRPKIIHYYNTAWNASMQLIPTGSFGSGSAIERLGIVQEMTLPHKDFIKSEDELQAEGNEVARVVWPDELRRFSLPEVIERALKRKGEKWYNLVKNNCETFAMSCLCGLEISPQVTLAVQSLCEVGNTLIKLIRQAAQQVLKVCKLRSARIDVARNVLPRGALAIGTAVAIIAEVILLCYDIYKAKDKWDKGVVIKSRKDFIKEVIDIVVSAFFRAGGSVGGMILGQFLIPIPVGGGIVGAVGGVVLGHWSAKLLTETGLTERFSKRIDAFIAAKKDTENKEMPMAEHRSSDMETAS